jgi:hypothetical protein
MLYREIIAVCSQIHTMYCILCFVSFCVSFACKCVLNYCHRVTTQLQLINIRVYHIISKHINTLCGQSVELYIKIQTVPRSKHTPSLL